MAKKTRIIIYKLADRSREYGRLVHEWQCRKLLSIGAAEC